MANYVVTKAVARGVLSFPGASGAVFSGAVLSVSGALLLLVGGCGPSYDEHTIKTADEWVTAIESGRGAAFTLPTVMQNFTTARVRVSPVEDLPHASVLLAWRSGDRDPLVEAFVGCALAVLGSAVGVEG